MTFQEWKESMKPFKKSTVDEYNEVQQKDFEFMLDSSIKFLK